MTENQVKSMAMTVDEIKELFSNYKLGIVNGFSFIESILFHNASCHPTLTIDVVNHSEKSWFMFFNDIIEVKIG